MLRRPHVQPFVRERDGALEVDYLASDPRVLAFLDRALELVRRLEGRPVRVVTEALRRQERRVRDARRLRGITKTLLDVSRIEPAPGAERAPEVRAALFRARGTMWPPLPGDREAPYALAGTALGLAPADVARLLYADRPEAWLLVRAPRLTPEALLDRYNLELARGVLLDATRVALVAQGGWRRIFAAVKLARLMYRLEPAGRGYRLELTGPAAPFVVRAERYGARLARVVPALVAAPRWQLDAEVVRDRRSCTYHLDAGAPFARRARRARYDSSWERGLARDFAAKLGDERGGWTLSREATPVSLGGDLFLPDFTLRHRDGRQALVEIVGFWTPEYLEAKLAKVAAARLENLILVVYRGLAVGDAAQALNDAAAPVLWFTERPKIGEVLALAERVARRRTT